MCDTLWQEALSVRSGDNRTFLPGRRDHVALCVTQVVNVRVKALSALWGPFAAGFPAALWKCHTLSHPEPMRMRSVLRKPTETRYGHRYQRPTKAEQQHGVENIGVENIELKATGMSPFFILSLEAAKIAVTSLISFPRCLGHK